MTAPVRRRRLATGALLLLLLAPACSHGDDGSDDEAVADGTTTSAVGSTVPTTAGPASPPSTGAPPATIDVTPTTAASPVCTAADRYRTADEAVDAAATGGIDGQVRAQDAWHAALAELGVALPPGPEQDAAVVLQGATTTVSEQPWTTEQQQADGLLTVFLDAACPRT